MCALGKSSRSQHRTAKHRATAQPALKTSTLWKQTAAPRSHQSGRKPIRPAAGSSPRAFGAPGRAPAAPLPLPPQPAAGRAAEGSRCHVLLRAARGRPVSSGRAAAQRRVSAMAVLLETTLGDLVIDLYTEERPRGRSGAGAGAGRGKRPRKAAGRRGAAGGGGSACRRISLEVPVLKRRALLAAAAVALGEGERPAPLPLLARLPRLWGLRSFWGLPPLGCGVWEKRPLGPSRPRLPGRRLPGSCRAVAAPLAASWVLRWA